MSGSVFTDAWLQCPTANDLENDTLTWTTSISRTRVSTVDGLGLSENIDVEVLTSFESLLRTVQQLKLKRIPVDELEEIRFVAAGETFAVSECRHEGKAVAIKRIRLSEDGGNSNRQYFQRRLQAVLREVLIMCHLPLAHHPNIIDFLGYGWSIEGQRPSPFVSVEFSFSGSLRKYMQDSCRSAKAKLILAGDVAAGLMALHRCGIVHGDMKIDNVVVFPSMERPSMSIAKLSDFGHSLFVSSSPEKRTHYFGTTLYNAPEVADQKNQPIPLEELHKCDIWAFGLCIWEILLNGEIYFQRSWRNNPFYGRPPAYSTPSTSIKTESNSLNDFSLDENDQHVFGRFDPSHLMTLAKESVSSMNIRGLGSFERGIIRGLFSCTLQTSPSKRISDLNRLPIIGFWNKVPGSISLQSKLATYTVSGDIRYSIFSKDVGPHIPWDQQQQLLQDFEAVAQQTQFEKHRNDAAFQTMLCYINAFGTSRNYSKAAQFLREAGDAGHLLSRIFGANLLDAFSQSPLAARRSYSECLALGFRTMKNVEQPSNIVMHHDEIIAKFPDYATFQKAFLLDMSMGKIKTKNVRTVFITFGESQIRHNVLEIAIQYNDIRLVNRILPAFTGQLNNLNSQGESFLVQAACRGNSAIVTILLEAGASLASPETTSVLHWLFCLEDLSDNIRRATATSEPLYRKQILNNPVPQKIVLHPQWPFQVHGTPLATAVAAGSVTAVKTLLELGADPLTQAFPLIDNELTQKWTPIHLAVRYNFVEILQLLWAAAFNERPGMPLQVVDTPTLTKFPLACALSSQTNAERFAMHGSDYIKQLRNAIQLFSPEALLQTSLEGKTVITQAIDLEDIDTIEILLDIYPELAWRRLENPRNLGSFTYPLHFATQIGSGRDTEESLQILNSIIQLDPTAVDKPDSSSLKPLHIAAMGLSVRITKFLLERGASIYGTDRDGRGPLHFCHSGPNVKILLESGADIDLKAKTGLTAVHTAAIRGAEDVLQTLINAGANVNILDKEKGMPLHCAARRKSRSVIDILVRAGAVINAQDTDGRTPLHLAMDAVRPDLVQFLLEHGADPFIEDKHGSSPFRMALSWSNPVILNKFQESEGFESLSKEKRLGALHFAAEHGEPVALRQYLHKISDSLPSVKSQSFEKDEMMTAIHTAASAFRPDLVEVLLSCGFKVDTLDNNGNTPLLAACAASKRHASSASCSRTTMCEKLLNNGADMLAKNRKGATPFLLAQLHEDYSLMTLLLGHALALSDTERSVRLSRVMEAITSEEADHSLCEAAKDLIGSPIDLKLIQKAAAEEELDLLMTCIAGQFVSMKDLQLIFKSKAVAKSQNLQILRIYSVKEDRDMVRYLIRGQYSEITNAYSVGKRNLEQERINEIKALKWIEGDPEKSPLAKSEAFLSKIAAALVPRSENPFYAKMAEDSAELQ